MGKTYRFVKASERLPEVKGRYFVEGIFYPYDNEVMGAVDFIPPDKWHMGKGSRIIKWLEEIPKDERQKEVEELKAWKAEAIAVMPDFQAIGKALGNKLGESVHDKILPGIERLKSLVISASRLVGNNGDDYRACDKWQYDYNEWEKETFRKTPLNKKQ